ncbi:MAG: hypothetical protein HY858_12020 [Candidatus Solibacter usitatus]|nr:hypothetical protein [Candidatus Solibacter usitatus]
MQRLVRPGNVLAAALALTALRAIVQLATVAWPIQTRILGYLAGPMLIIIPNLLAAWLAWKISQDHEGPSAMGLCWRLMMLGAAVNALRNLYEVSSFLAGRLDPARYPALGLRQILIVLSLLLMIAALLSMWSSFASLGLGVRPRVLDVCLTAAILLLVPPVFAGRGLLSDAISPYAVVRYLQYASPFLLAVPAALAVVLCRISSEMGGGALAIALRLFAASFALRLIALIGATAPWLRGEAILALFASHFFVVLSSAAHWLVVLGLSYRWELSHSAIRLIRRYEDHGAEELAGLAGSLTSHTRP